MKKRFTCPTVLVLGLWLVASAANAGECQPVEARIGVTEKLGPCEYLGVLFFNCIQNPIRGTLNGTWHYYGPLAEGSDEDPAIHLEWFPGPTPPDPFPAYSPLLVLGWGLDVFETNRGELWAQDSYVINAIAQTSDGGLPVVQLSHIVGGTGAWEGAWGWLGLIFADDSEWRGFLRGEICTP